MNVCFCLNSAYHLVLSFPHLVVILTTLGTPKNIFCFNNNIMSDNSKKDNPGKNKFGCTLFTELRGRDMRALPRIFRLFEYPKQSLLKSSHPKKYLPNFPTQKNPGVENFRPPKKSFDHPRHLNSRVPPLGSGIQGGGVNVWKHSGIEVCSAVGV